MKERTKKNWSFMDLVSLRETAYTDFLFYREEFWMVVKWQSRSNKVLTTSDRDLLELHGKKVMSWFPGLEVVSRCIPDQPEGIHDDTTEQAAVPKVINLAKEFESEGFDGILVSCAGDPGVNELKDMLSIPVVGAGRTTACIALSFDLPVGVLGITDEVPVGMKAVLQDA